MALHAGSRLGPYEIIRLLGEGGMGEVYRARDSRLDRDVAIKVLPASLTSDPDLRRRFEREARTISSLSHPHICPLFDIGHQEGIDFLVMEHLDGETLAARLEQGPLPLDQVLRHGSEIASALAAAHRRGVVHRDLKPGNIMLTRSGARLLDFGLAKPAAASSGATVVDVTVSGPITAHGTILGTYPYMAPEQVEGREVDARSDIFAFGAVLYEMATGKRAFEGRSAASVMAAILEREPPALSALQPLAPSALDEIVRGCLAKDPDERWQSAHDIKLQLDGLRRRAGSEQVAAATPGGRRLAALLTGAIVILAGLLSGVLILWPASRDAAAGPPVRASLLPPPAHSFTPNDFQISPDGRRVAFVAAGADGVSTLWVRSLLSPQPTEIAGSEGAAYPFWSPDSRWIAFFARGKLFKVEPGGGGVQEICAAMFTVGGGAWGADDVIVFASAVIGPLVRVAAGGGTPVPVTQMPADQPGEAHRFPQFLPDGKRFLYVSSWTNQQRGGLYLAHADGGAPELVSSEIRGRVVLAGSHLLYFDSGNLYAQTFDEATGRLSAERGILLRNEVVSDWRFGDLPLSASRTGTLVFQSRLEYDSRLVWYDRSGRELGPVGPSGFSSPALSPDGRRVAVSYDANGSGAPGTTIFDLDRNLHYPLPSSGIHTWHVWSPDGRWIYYAAMRDANAIYRRPADGSGNEELILESKGHLIVNGFSPRSPKLLFMDFAEGVPTLKERDLESSTTAPVALGAEGVYSPDGEWIAHVGFPAGIIVRPAREAGQLVATTAGYQVRWRDMQELFYIAPDKKLMSVPLTVRDGTLEAGKPRELFQTRIVQPRFVLFQYDVTADGQRFLINSLPPEEAAAPLTLLVNWTAAIGR